MSDHRRREGLGRNRQGPATRNHVPLLVVAVTFLVAAGIFAFTYYTAPERVLGSKMLDCPPHEITWRGENPTRIEGCGKTIFATCDDERCRDQDEPLPRQIPLENSQY